jgi:hypothetical protein
MKDQNLERKEQAIVDLEKVRVEKERELESETIKR